MFFPIEIILFIALCSAVFTLLRMVVELSAIGLSIAWRFICKHKTAVSGVAALASVSLAITTIVEVSNQ